MRLIIPLLSEPDSAIIASLFRQKLHRKRISREMVREGDLSEIGHFRGIIGDMLMLKTCWQFISSV